MNFFLFTANDMPIDSSLVISVELILHKLITNKIWLFSAHTPSKNRLKPGDKVLFYICGPNRRYFGGSATINSYITEVKIDSDIAEIRNELGLKWFDSFIYLTDISLFKNPVHIKELITSLEFIKNKRNYGLNLRLPIISIPEQDYRLITSLIIPRI